MDVRINEMSSIPRIFFPARNAERADRSNGKFRRIDVPNTTVDLKTIASLLQSLETCRANTTNVSDLMHQFVGALNDLRLSMVRSDWRKTVQAIRTLPHFNVIHEDPFTWRAFEKPRGYAGDAVMMDHIYCVEENWLPPTATELGQQIFSYTSRSESAAGVRARREQIARILDEQLFRVLGQSVLSIACGHLREAAFSSTLRRGRFNRFLATDADVQSLDTVAADYGFMGIETALVNVAELMRGSASTEKFDLVYSTGLYDYLTARVATALTRTLFDRVNSGGKLVIANFLPSIRDIGYMEACMDWFLIYRDRIAMADLTAKLDPREIREMRIWTEENQNVIFLEIQKY